MQPRFPRFLGRALLVLGAVGSTLLVLEVAVRVFDLGRLPRLTSGEVYAREFPNLSSEGPYVPGAIHHKQFQRFWGDEPITVVTRIGSRGFRACDALRQKPPGVLRIACLGDSMTFGRGVNDDETWPARLELALAGEDGGNLGGRPRQPSFEVWNCGVEGTQTREQLMLLRKQVLAAQPDVVLLGYYINDVTCGLVPTRMSVVGPGTELLVRTLEPRPGARTAAPMVAEVRRYSVLVDRMLGRLQLRYAGLIANRVYTAAYERNAGGWRQVKRQLREMRDLLAARGTAFGVVLLPVMERDGEHLASHAAYEIVARFCATEGIALLDTEPLFRECDPRLLIVHPRDHHLNAEAYERIGSAAAEFVRGLAAPSGGVEGPVAAIGEEPR